MTDILTPLMAATDMVAAVPTHLPFVFLITDGKVENEKDICNWALHLGVDPRFKGRQVPRVSTFGIGMYCNHYFLKQLASSARGLNDMALKPTYIQSQMERLLLASEKPVLYDITLGIAGLANIELYPFPIPDLFAGNPLVISGKYTGAWPQSITVNGVLPNGARWQQVVATTQTASIPLDKVFARQRLDLLTAKAWLTDDPKVKKEVTDFSVRENIPCVYTSMVGFEVNQAKYKEYESMRNQHKLSGGKIAGMAIGGAAAVAVVGITVLEFGNIAASLGNLPIGDAFGAIGGGLMDAFGDIGGVLGDVGGFLGNVGGEAIGAIGNIGGEAINAIGNVGGDAIGFCGNICSSGCGDIGNMCDCLFSDGCNLLGQCVGGIAGCIGDCVG